jgi:Ca2+-dependent lipid-binding protein
MRVEMTFCPKSPFLHTLTYAFIHPPIIQLSIKPLKAIDIMEIPFLKESIEESLRYMVSTTLVLPEQIVIPYFSWYAKGKLGGYVFILTT